MNLSQIFSRPSKPENQTTLPPVGGGDWSRRTANDPRVVSPQLNGVRICRQVWMDLETFDAFKAWCRALVAHRGRNLSNSEVMRMLILALPPAPYYPRTGR